MFGYFERHYTGSSVASNVIMDILLPLIFVFALSKLKPNWKCILFMFLRFVILHAANLMINNIVYVMSSGLSEWNKAFIDFFIPPMLLIILVPFVCRDYKLTTRIAWTSLLVTAWYLLPAITFIVPIFSSSGGIISSIPRVVIMALLIIVLKRWNIDKLQYHNIWPIIVFESVCVIGCAIQILNFIDGSFDSLMHYVNLLAWVVEALVYFFYYKFVSEYNKKIETSIQNQKLKGEMQLMDFMKDNYQQMRMLKHDIKNQYSYLSLLYAQGKHDEAKTFFDNVQTEAKGILSYISTGNTVIDITMNMAKERAKTAGVDAEIICIVPNKTRFLDNDMFSLLVNLTDNAIDAAEKADAEKKFVKISMTVSSNHLLINISNSVSSTADIDDLLKMKTQKPNKTIHGFGSKIIKSIVKKYDGDVIFDVTDNIFNARVMLALEGMDALMKKEKAS